MVSKNLVVILSCSAHALNGYNQVMRDTWLKHVDDYKFFMGSGKPSGEDETLLWMSWEKSGVYKNKAVKDPSLKDYALKQDEVILDVPDNYTHVGYKLRGACRWALEKGYDYIFQGIIDTFAIPQRLLSSGFEKHDYVGSANNERTSLGGGAGFWLSKKAMQILADAPVTHWAYDAWSGEVLLKNGIQITHDPRYTNLEQIKLSPRRDNDIITSHIANTPTVYDPARMFELYNLAKAEGLL